MPDLQAVRIAGAPVAKLGIGVRDFEMDALVALLHEDATMSMPPYELWLRGAPEIRA